MSRAFMAYKKKFFPKATETLSDSLRWKLREALSPCDTCKTYQKSQRQLARDIGILDSTIVQFLKGKAIDSGTLDKIVRYFQRVEP